MINKIKHKIGHHKGVPQGGASSSSSPRKSTRKVYPDKSSLKIFTKGNILLGAKKKIVVVASGYFDPIHSGHINYLKEAKKLGDELVVIVNNEKQARLKKQHSFLQIRERKVILESIKYVDRVFVSIDSDRSVSKSLAKIKPDIFAVGMDNYKNKLKEKETCEKFGIKIVDKLARRLIIHPSMKQSSSKILKSYIKKRNCKKCGGKLR